MEAKSSKQQTPTGRAYLALEWVYGYRGHECRNNLFYSAEGKIVYFVAGVAIAWDVNQNQQRFFNGHNDDLLCLCMHPDKKTFATGQIGKKPYVCIWDSATMKTVSILKDVQHEDGIGCVAFSNDGEYMLSVGVDSDATLSVWNWKKAKQLAKSSTGTQKVFDAQFLPRSNDQIMTCGLTHLKLWSLKGNALTGTSGDYSWNEAQALLCIAFAPESTVVTGLISGSLLLWQNQSLKRTIADVHQGGVYTIAQLSDGSFATGGKDAQIKLWDQKFKPISTISLASCQDGYPELWVRAIASVADKLLVGTHLCEIFEIPLRDREHPVCLVNGHSQGELWALAAHPKKQIFATGGDDQTLRIWNALEHKLVQLVEMDAWVRSCAVCPPDGSLLALGLSNGSFCVLRCKDFVEITKQHDHKRPIHELKFSPNGEYLAVGCNDGSLDLYQVSQRFRRVGSCPQRSSHVTHLDWSTDSKFVQVNTGSGERSIFKMPACQVVESNAPETKTITWFTWTCTLGPEVAGIWPKFAKAEDINAVTVNTQRKLLATGDDYGFVKLFSDFPLLSKGAQFTKYIGHSAHVTNVKWLSDNETLISTGGMDHAVFQWKLTTTKPDGQAVESDSEDESEPAAVQDDLDSDVESAKNADRYKRRTNKEKVAAKFKLQVRKEVQQEGKGRLSSPSASLQLQHVFGYRGFDCHGNVFFTLKGEIAYHIAAIGVILNLQTGVQRHYFGHTDDILCIAAHPTKDILATGQVGSKPPIHVWDADTMKVVSILKDQHAAGICALDFSTDGKNLVSVGLDDTHTIVLWNWSKGEKLASGRGHKDKIFAVKFVPHNASQFVTVGVKHIKFWTHAGGGFTSTRGIFGNVAQIDTLLCICFGSQADVCYTGSASGKLLIWKGVQLTKSVQVTPPQTMVAATSSAATKSTEATKALPCFAIAALDKGFVTGGKDGAVTLWNETFDRCLKSYVIASSSLVKSSPPLVQDRPVIRAVTLGHGKIIAATKNGEIVELEQNGSATVIVQGHKEGELWGLSYHPSEHECATASDDGVLRLWSLGEPKCLMAYKDLKKAARSVAYSPDAKLLAVGFKDGSFSIINSSTLAEVCSLKHRNEEISALVFSPASANIPLYLAVGSHDNFVDIYDVVSQKRVGICKGASSYITHIDWNSEGSLIQINSGARERLFFEMPSGKRETIAPEMADTIDWHSWTCVLGDTCKGIWPPSSDVTDINSVALNKSSQTLASGDDFGFLKLFVYPAKEKYAKFKQYLCHSAHVTSVSWSFDSQFLVTTGGADTALCLWKLIGASESTSGHSDTSDTDSEEEGGYDSDVQEEKAMDYSSKTYSKSLKCRLQLEAGTTANPGEITRYLKTQKPLVNRKLTKTINVKRSEPSSSSHAGAPSTKNGLIDKRKQTADIASAVSSLMVTNNKHAVSKLKLEYVFGYRGSDCSCNLFYVNDGTGIVYHAAGVGIVLDLASGQQQFYTEHSDDILALSVNKNPKFKNLVATAQIDAVKPTIHVWDIESLKTVSILQAKHDKGINNLDFSSSGRFLLSVGIDDAHTLSVWKFLDGGLVASGPGHSRKICCAMFRPDSDSEFVTVGIKHVKFWKVCGGQLVGKRGIIKNPSDSNDGDVKERKSAAAKNFTMLSVAFAPDKITYTGCVTGDVYVWRAAQLDRIIRNAHSGPIFAMHTSLADGLIVTGAKEKRTTDSGCVKLWDQQMNRSKRFQLEGFSDYTVDVVKSVCRHNDRILVGTKDCDIVQLQEKSTSVYVIMQSHSAGELGGLSCHPFKEVVATASFDRHVMLWDLQKKVMLRRIALNQDACQVHYSADGSLIAVGLRNGEFQILHAADLTLWYGHRDRNSPVTEIRFGPNGLFLAVAHQEAVVDVYDISKGPGTVKRVAYCKAISAPVAHLDFSADSKYIKVSTTAYAVMYFRIPEATQVTDPAEIGKIIWTSWTDVCGAEVVGIWPDQQMQTYIFCADLTHMNATLATGDNFGMVKLFGFPCEEKFANHLTYTGHSSNVTNVRFTYDDGYLVSTGGDDAW